MNDAMINILYMQLYFVKWKIWKWFEGKRWV